MATQRDGGLVARSVREALGTLVSPEMYTQLLTRALRRVGMKEIPEQGRAVGRFVRDALLRELEDIVGEDAAEMVAQQLAPAIAHAAASEPATARQSDRSEKRGSDRSDKRASKPNPFSEHPTGLLGQQPRRDQSATARMKLTPEEVEQLHGEKAGHTYRPQPTPSDRSLRRVLVASSARPQVEALQGYLHGTGAVVAVSDLVGLLDALDDKSLSEPIVLLDCQRPTVHVSSIAAIGEDLPMGTTIVVWGIDERAWSELDRDRVPSCKWVRCSHEATAGDIGALVATLIRQG